jgi:hypothetical protein
VDGSNRNQGRPKKWRDELIKELRRCDAFVPILSSRYVESEHCRMEIFIARSRGCAVLPLVVDDCLDALDRFEETKGLTDTFMVRLHRLSLVGLAITRAEAIERVISAIRSIGQAPPKKLVYVSYSNDEADLATTVARQLEEEHGLSSFVATRDIHLGDDWRQAQARGVMNASAQVVVMDERIARAKVLRTEILLAEAFGLPVFSVLNSKLAGDPHALGRVMTELGTAGLTYRRLTDIQAFRPEQGLVNELAGAIRQELGI